MQLSNYMFFTANCEAALDYSRMRPCRIVEQDCTLRRETACRPGARRCAGKIMHAKLRTGSLFTPPTMTTRNRCAGRRHIMMMDDREKTTKLLRALGERRKVTTALGIQPWGDYTHAHGPVWGAMDAELHGV